MNPQPPKKRSRKSKIDNRRGTEICFAPAQCKQANIQSFFSTFKRPRCTLKKSELTPCTPPSLLSTKSIETPPSIITPRESLVETPPTTENRDENWHSNIKGDKLKRTFKVKDQSSLQQLYLDLGQKNFGKQTICEICGMLFVHGLSEDDRQHKRVCQDFQKGVQFQAKNARIVEKTKNGDIVEIRPSDCYELRQKLKRVLKIVQNDLGFVNSLELANEKTGYLFVRGKRVVGMALAEVTSKAFVLESNMDRSNEARKAMVGIHQIWVHHKCRRMGIATQLVDSIRTKFIFGLVVPSQMLAFSSPTELGASFARKYIRESTDVENAKVLVYDCV
mmetsp:Transcript_10085/g.14805  ORF Transcript_10085/g.14805 Transcript_10085/m.14805 type:complete len:334 (-) Transcript_10085:30-1031(-)